MCLFRTSRAFHVVLDNFPRKDHLFCPQHPLACGPLCTVEVSPSSLLPLQMSLGVVLVPAVLCNHADETSWVWLLIVIGHTTVVLTVSPPTFAMIPTRALGAGRCRNCIIGVFAGTGVHRLYVLWLVVVFCNGLCLLPRGVSLMSSWRILHMDYPMPYWGTSYRTADNEVSTNDTVVCI